MSNNPLQRIADLEAQVSALHAENIALKERANRNGHSDLIDAIGRRLERVGQTLREDYAGKLAGLIHPYVESTVRRCAETESRQTELEERFKEFEQLVGNSALEMAEAFVLQRRESAKDWKAQRDQIQQDLTRVDNFVKWFKEGLEKCAAATEKCQSAATQCQELTEKVNKPVTETIEHLNEIKSQGETAIKRATQHLGDTYQNLRRPVLKFVAGFLLACVIIQVGLGGLIFLGNRAQMDANLQGLTKYSEQQKQELGGLLDRTFEEAKEAQIEKEIKVKMWDAFMKSLPSQQRQAVIGKFRWQVNDAERKRIDEQMSSSYDQMNKTK